MRGEIEMTGPEMAMAAGSRVAFGVGAGLLLAGLFSTAEARRTAGWTLLATGLFAGAVLGYKAFGRSRPLRMSFGSESNGPGRPKSTYRGSGSRRPASNC